MSTARVTTALRELGLEQIITRHGPVNSLAEAARIRGVALGDIIKTLVIRRGPDDFLFVLVPGDREFSWPKLRALLGVSRVSMPDAETAFEVTGYPRGTITPFGATHRWPVIADASITGRRVSMGAGEPGVSISLDADSMLAALNATVADISDVVAAS